MTNLSISSTVTAQYMSLTSEELIRYLDFDEGFRFDSVTTEKKIDFDALIQTERALDSKIVTLLHGMDNTQGSGAIYTITYFNGKQIKIDYRRTDHFEVGMLISLFNLIHKTVKFKGSMYFFNKDLISRFRTVDIISFMKVKNRLSYSEMQQGINNLSKEFKSITEIDKSEIEQSIQYLESLGFVDKDSYDESMFKLTAKGYMLVL